MVSRKKSAGLGYSGYNFLEPTATTLQMSFHGSLLARAVRWPGSNRSRLALRVTRGVMPPRPRAKAVSHASAPTSTLSSASFAALLLADLGQAQRDRIRAARGQHTPFVVPEAAGGVGAARVRGLRCLEAIPP